MSDIKIIPSPVDPKRFFIMKGAQAVAQGDYKGRSEDQIMQDFTAKVGAPQPQGNVNPGWLEKTFRDEAMQQKLLGGAKNPKQQVDMAKDIKALTGPSPATDIPKDAMEALNEIDRAIEINATALRFKDKNKVDTGPLTSFLQKTGIYNALDKPKPELQTFYNLQTLNPYRKMVTGAQAAETELRKFIVPALPGLQDNDEVYKQKAYAYDNLMKYNRQLFLEGLKARGYDVKGFEDRKVKMFGLDDKARSDMDLKAQRWALENLASPDYEKKAKFILEKQGVPVGSMKDLDSWISENKEEFEKLPDQTKGWVVDQQTKQLNKSMTE